MRDPQRRTGRTSRMLKEAIKLATEGKQVYVLAAHEPHKRDLLWRLRDNPSVLDAAAVTVVTPRSADFDWRSLTFRGVNPETIVLLIDHYTIEFHFSTLFKMYRRFDLDRREGRQDGGEEA